MVNLEEEVELIDLRRPVRRDIFDRPEPYRTHPKHLSIVELRIAQFRLDCDAAAYSRRVRGLIIGENPGKQTHPELPLFPWPERSSAGRLLEMSGMTGGQYLGGLYRRNLCDTKGKWERDLAEKRARVMITVLFDMPKDLRVVLCGKRVAKAFGYRDYEFWRPGVLESRQRYVVIPHPSGLNRLYNDRENRARTRAVMRWAAIGEELS